MILENEAKPLPFQARGPVELCACGHANDHRSRRCGHELDDGTTCRCAYGMRTDTALVLQNVSLIANQNEMLKRMQLILDGVNCLVQIAAKQAGVPIGDDAQPMIEHDGIVHPI